MQSAPATPVLLEWQSLDSHPHERSSRWYAVGGVFVIAFAAYGLIEGSWSTTLLALLIGAMYFLMRNVQPGNVLVQIDGLGIRVGSSHTPWVQLKEFWIVVADNHVELHATRKNPLMPEVSVFIQEVDPAVVREVMLQFLPEREGMNERLLDFITRILKL